MTKSHAKKKKEERKKCFTKKDQWSRKRKHMTQKHEVKEERTHGGGARKNGRGLIPV